MTKIVNEDHWEKISREDYEKLLMDRYDISQHQINDYLQESRGLNIEDKGRIVYHLPELDVEEFVPIGEYDLNEEKGLMY